MPTSLLGYALDLGLLRRNSSRADIGVELERLRTRDVARGSGATSIDQPTTYYAVIERSQWTRGRRTSLT